MKVRLLAICLGNFNGHLHFYTHTGKWFTSRNPRSGFVVKNFVDDPAELQGVIDAIPSISSSSTVLNELQDLNIGPSRDRASSLLRKMLSFQTSARLIHQTYVERLSRANSTLGDEEKLLSLREVAEKLLPGSLKRHKTTFPPEALYAIYSVLDEDDVAFRPLSTGARHHESYLFLLHSADAQENVHKVEELVREYYESLLSRKADRHLPSSVVKFKTFLTQARAAIDRARKVRDWSPYGMVGPCKQDASEKSLENPAWSTIGLAVIKFMQHWAASGGFRYGSRCHWIGSSILRAIGRYEDALLDGTTGWTFLQEIGWIPPWDVSARHYLRLPGLQLDRHAGLLPAPAPDAPASVLAEDRLAHLRQDFARSTVYCIDSADTLDVDDGVSLEAAGAGNYWIHVHIADPASRISPGTKLAEQAAVQAQTSYLSGFYRRMLDDDEVREAFSLGANQPTLTFSALVSENGRLIDWKVTPGTLRDVVCITPAEVASVCGDSGMQVPPDVLEVGTPPTENTAREEMVTARELSRKQRNELRKLSELAHALQKTRLKNGAIPAYLPQAKAKVSLDNVELVKAGNGSAYYRGDPYIRVSYEESTGSPLVNSLMQLAGEVAARWCYERDIPIPYRIQLLANQNSEALREFTRNVFYPKLAAGKNPPPEDYHTLRTLVGGFDVSTTPAPNFAMGLDLYTKVTSPLRRYLDLLVHWQIEAALLEEHRLGKSLAVRKSPGYADATATSEQSPSSRKATSANKSFLPFTKQQLEDNVLPRLRIRERHGRLLDNYDGNGQWILQALVRAWHFGENADMVPRTFLFTTSDVVGKRVIKGRLDWFDRPASVELEHLNGVIRIGDVKPGDVFRVELANVNVHTNKIDVKLLEKLQ